MLEVDDEHQDLLGAIGIRVIQPVMADIGQVSTHRRAEQIHRLIKLANLIGGLAFPG